MGGRLQHRGSGSDQRGSAPAAGPRRSWTWAGASTICRRLRNRAHDRRSAGALTTTPDVAETQPDAMVATEPDGGVEGGSRSPRPSFRTDGSIAVMAARSRSALASTCSTAEDLCQSSEAAWSSIEEPRRGRLHVDDGRSLQRCLRRGAEQPGLDRPARRWMLRKPHRPRTRRRGAPPDVDRRRCRTKATRSGASSSRGVRRAVIPRTSSSESGPHDADIGDVLAQDGSDRRVIVDAVGGGELAMPFDEAGPAYSPDGEQIAFSRALLGERMLMRAAADGTGEQLLLAESERDPAASDTDPAWSPDGTQVAFVRSRTARNRRVGVRLGHRDRTPDVGAGAHRLAPDLVPGRPMDHGRPHAPRVGRRDT